MPEFRHRTKTIAGAAAVALLVVGFMCALMGYRVWALAHASAGSDHPISVSAGEYLFFGGAAVLCWTAMVLLIIRVRRR